MKKQHFFELITIENVAQILGIDLKQQLQQKLRIPSWDIMQH